MLTIGEIAAQYHRNEAARRRLELLERLREQCIKRRDAESTLRSEGDFELRAEAYHDYLEADTEIRALLAQIDQSK